MKISAVRYGRAYAHNFSFVIVLVPQNILLIQNIKRIFFIFKVDKYFIQHCSIVPEDAGIEARTVATLALAVRRSLDETWQSCR
jgi:hypothetical protein